MNARRLPSKGRYHHRSLPVGVREVQHLLRDPRAREHQLQALHVAHETRSHQRGVMVHVLARRHQPPVLECLHLGLHTFRFLLSLVHLQLEIALTAASLALALAGFVFYSGTKIPRHVKTASAAQPVGGMCASPPGSPKEFLSVLGVVTHPQKSFRAGLD